MGMREIALDNLNKWLLWLIMMFPVAFMPVCPAFADDAEKSAAKSVNAFAFDMYRNLIKSENGNIFFSPYSISSAMAMLYAGTSDEAKREIHAVMRYPDDTHLAMRELREILDEGASGDLSIANAIWPDSRLELLPSYVNTIKENYGGEVTQFDYLSKWREAENAINSWTDLRTRGMIKNIIPQGSLQPKGEMATSLVLTNAVYFFSEWFHTFNKNSTRDEVFYGTSEEKTKLMRQTNSFPYFETEDFQMISLPYKSGKRSLVVVLPRRRDGIKQLEESITSENFSDWRTSSAREQVTVYLPKLEMEWNTDLSERFQSMGLENIFKFSVNNYKNLTSDRKYPMCVSQIFHKAHVIIDEEGTEAAAVTAIIMAGTTSMPPSRTYEFRADHPFIFFIADNATGAILFMGRYNKPN
jgi:serpin B